MPDAVAAGRTPRRGRMSLADRVGRRDVGCARDGGAAEAGGVSGSSRADERGDRRVDQEGLAQRGADPRHQLRRARGMPPGRGERRGRPSAIERFGVRRRPGWLHHDQRARGERRAAGPDRAAADNADGTLTSALSGKTYLLTARIVGISTEIGSGAVEGRWPEAPALPLATYSQLRQGETVFAFGSPIGMRNTLTHGLVSAVARQVDPDSPQIYVQTDAPINPGNSGGPLVNIRGEVVGINTFIVSQSGGNEGLGFAIPSATVRTVFRQLKQYGQLRRQEIGMSLQTITPGMAASLGLASDYGVIVSDVWPGGPAEAAGLKVGDILVSVDGQPADNLPTVSYNFRLQGFAGPRAADRAERSGGAEPERRRRSRSGATSIRCRRWRIREESGSRARHPRRRDRSDASPPPRRGSAIRTASSWSRERPARRAKCRCSRGTSSAA